MDALVDILLNIMIIGVLAIGVLLTITAILLVVSVIVGLIQNFGNNNFK